MEQDKNKIKTKKRDSWQALATQKNEKKIKVDILGVDNKKYDGSNELVLPSEKRATKTVRDKNAPPVKLLSKKQRKKLTKIVDQKKKKENRASLLAALDEVKADPKDLQQLTQLQATQTLGRKKFLIDGFANISSLKNAEEEDEEEKVISAIKGKKRKRAFEEKVHDPSVIRLGEMSSSDDDDDDEMEYNGENGSDDEEICDKDTSHDTEKEPAVESMEISDVPQDTVQKEVKILTENVEIVKESIAGIPAVFVTLNRKPEIQENRLKLPILAEEQVIMEAINENPVTVVVGATGSGKTTQVPQFLYEAGYASGGKMIGVTEPRRVAAISMSERVADEMNLSSEEVSYQIRFEGNAGADTRIKFMTDGVLLKEIQLDPSLKKYSAIIIDEAHERSVFSDILIGILSRIIPRRAAKNKPLKLIIMSATLRVEDFTTNERLFRNSIPPVLKVDARMYDVTIHYNKRTAEDYTGEAYKKVTKIHQQLPEGAILVFLTGQQEVNTLVRKLRAAYPFKGTLAQIEGSGISGYKRKRLEVKEKKKARKKGEELAPKKITLKDIKLDDFVSALPDDEEHEEADTLDSDNDPLEDSDLDLNDEDEEQSSGPKFGADKDQQPLWVLPMYSMLPPERQRAIFEPPPPGTRLCVVATNVAETSLTIPNTKYVVDCGKVKEKVYDKVTGVSMFHVTWVSQASANQRAGRAGRTAPGHCYRLYSSAIFNDEFQKFATAEIQRRPIDDLVLVMKSMNLPVINFPFPTPPDYLQIRHAVRRLVTLGALEDQSDSSKTTLPPKKKKEPVKDLTRITPLGSAMASFPLAPRYAKMLALSHQHDLLPYTIALVSALTVQEVLIETPLDTKESGNDLRRKWQSLRLSWAGSGASRMLGDNMVLLRAVGAAQFNGGTREWCDMNGLRHKGVIEIFKLRRQLTNEINIIIPSCSIILDPQMPPPSSDQARLLQQIVLSGSVDHVARRVDDWEVKNPEDKPKWRNAYRTMELEDPVFLPSSSVLRIDMPQWLVYQDIYETNKMFMRS
ncbi:unnamed protein product, partial [Meganyctiphanes norvegica]